MTPPPESRRASPPQPVGPMLYAALMDRALDKPVPQWNELIDRQLARLSNVLTESGLEAMREAYIAGVRDGFQQGVQAGVGVADGNPDE